ncbi:MAG: hypothetical protein ABEK16_01190 [Candidatus Nanohalobium sp.]
MATVSARVPEELKRQVSEEDISLSEVIRKALEEELKKRRREKIQKDAEKLSDKLQEVDSDEVVESIREDRKR